jgi:hypothetical protein
MIVSFYIVPTTLIQQSHEALRESLQVMFSHSAVQQEQQVLAPDQASQWPLSMDCVDTVSVRHTFQPAPF